MIKYLAKKLLSLLFVLVGISILAFLVGSLSPGDPAELALSKGGIYAPTDQQIAELRAQMGLDKPLYIQYFNWLKGVLTGDLGISYATDEPIAEVFLRRIPITLNLALCSFLLTVFMGIFLGLISSAHKDRALDHIVLSTTNVMLSLPSFWVALLMILLFSETLSLLPTSGYGSFSHLIMPSIVLSFGSIATTTRLMRSSMLEEFGKFYYTTTIAMGIPRVRLILYHTLRNAIIPVLPLLGSFTGAILGGSAIVETIFALPGLGSFIIESINVKDIPVIQLYVILTGGIYSIITTIVDILSAFLNPKLRGVIKNE